MTKIDRQTFDGCTNLALTSLPEGLTEIDDYAFRNCTNLAITSIPAGVKYIKGQVFFNCIGLTTLTFKGTPSSYSFPTSGAFQGCTNLTTINVPWAEGAIANAPWGATNATINYNYTGEA